REIVDEVYSVTGASDSDDSGEIDETRDLDGTAMPLISVATGAELIDSLIYDETPVKLGPIAVSPRQLLYFGRWYFGREGEYEIKGSFRTDGSRTALTVERYQTKPRALFNRWHAIYDGD